MIHHNCCKEGKFGYVAIPIFTGNPARIKCETCSKEFLEIINSKPSDNSSSKKDCFHVCYNEECLVQDVCTSEQLLNCKDRKRSPS